MARFYQAPTPNFVDDFMYQPPWEMMQQALAVNEQGVQSSLAQAELFKNLDIKYIDDPVERENVEKIKNYYTSKADELTNAIGQDPMKWRSFLPEISKFSKELQEDMTTGNISKIQGSYTNLQQWMTDNEKYKTSDPSLYNRLYNKWKGDWAQGNRSLDKTFQGKQIVGSEVVNMLNKEMRDFMNDFKADKIEKQNGMYLVGEKWVHKDDVERAAYDLISSKPEFSGWIQQMGYDLEDPGYFDAETGKLREVFHFTDANGTPLNAEEIEQKRNDFLSLSPEEQQAQGAPFNYGLNSQHALSSGFRAMGNIYGHREMDIKADPVQMEVFKQNQQTNRNRETIQGANWRTVFTQGAIDGREKDRLAFDYYKLDFQAKQALKLAAAKGNKNAQAVLDMVDLNVLEGNSVRPDRSASEDLRDIRNGDASAITRNTEAFKYATENYDWTNYSSRYSNAEFIEKDTKGDMKDFALFAEQGLIKGWSKDKIVQEFGRQKNLKLPYEKRGFFADFVSKATEADAYKSYYDSMYDNYLEKKQEWYDNVYNKTVVGNVNYHPMEKSQTDLFLHDYKINPSHFPTIKEEKGFNGNVKYLQASDYSYDGRPTLRLVDSNGKTKLVAAEKGVKSMDTWTRNLIIQGVDPTKSADLISYMSNPQASKYITELQNSSPGPKPMEVTGKDGKPITKSGYRGFVNVGSTAIPMILAEDNSVYVKQEDGNLLHFDNMNIFTQEINKILN